MHSLLVHQSPAAGSWYPADAVGLHGLLREAFERSSKRTGPFVRPGALAFIVPHAAPSYSGAVAAAVYRHVEKLRPARILLLGFSHRWPLEGIGIPAVEEYETPLGRIQVDMATAGALANARPFQFVPEDLVCDHSVEIQLPFLQVVVPNAVLVPLYVGAMSEEERRCAAGTLRGFIDGQTVLIASSDLTHYGTDFGYVPFPFDEHTRDKLCDLDETVLSACGSLDPALFEEELARTGATVCGSGPISLLLETLRKLPGEEIFQETLDYDTSGEITGDYEQSVSYGAAGYFPASAFHIGESDRRVLLGSARDALEEYRRTGQRPFPAQVGPISLMQSGRAFVSLYSGAALRGCVGCFETPGPLAAIVPQLAVGAACEDSRFAPVTGEEQIEIELHILTPKKRVRDPGEIVTGEHGAQLEFEDDAGVLLPGVATKYGLDRTGFLETLAHKAGLTDAVYSREEARLYVFREQVVTEAEGEASAAGAVAR